LEPALTHGKRKSGVSFGPAARKGDQASKTKTGAGKSGGGEQKLGTMKAATELQRENKQNTSDRSSASQAHNKMMINPPTKNRFFAL
jgi:hypothetical protein